jgi:hypothetical protein
MGISANRPERVDEGELEGARGREADCLAS